MARVWHGAATFACLLAAPLPALRAQSRVEFLERPGERRIEGRLVGEVSEGDVFGELGLLEGGTREANVTVVSADAEVLFMSSRSFRHLLQTVPAFAWGIWETAASRRESIRRPRTSAP